MLASMLRVSENFFAQYPDPFSQIPAQIDSKFVIRMRIYARLGVVGLFGEEPLGSMTHEK